MAAPTSTIWRGLRDSRHRAQGPGSSPMTTITTWLGIDSALAACEAGTGAYLVQALGALCLSLCRSLWRTLQVASIPVLLQHLRARPIRDIDQMMLGLRVIQEPLAFRRRREQLLPL